MTTSETTSSQMTEAFERLSLAHSTFEELAEKRRLVTVELGVAEKRLSDAQLAFDAVVESIKKDAPFNTAWYGQPPKVKVP